jgi:replicative DNA helicase
MLLDQDAALKAAEILDDTMFYKESHRLLFRSMLSLTERGDVIDPVTLRDELSRRADLDRAGGMEYIAALIDVVPTAANIDYHARIVRDKAVLRRLVEAPTGIIQDIYEGKGHAAEVLDSAEHRIFEVAQFRRAQDFIRLKELIWPTMERIEQLQGRTVAHRRAPVSTTWTSIPPACSGVTWSFSRPGHRWGRRRSP